ncbi:MAG: hypothetical protein AAGC55_02600, partial [Myxococcota bacterium]
MSSKSEGSSRDQGAAQQPEEMTEHTLRRIIGERRDKAEKLRAGGHNPYRNDFVPSHSCAEIRDRYQDTRPAADESAAPAGRKGEDGGKDSGKDKD